ncbi:MAG: hypothetical protein DMG30_13935 [Acidobacteria bacterium]|nr:MAG: hypothetical protein DMG30_13935 [Acidobacteriota bacterium]
MTRSIRVSIADRETAIASATGASRGKPGTGETGTIRAIREGATPFPLPFLYLRSLQIESMNADKPSCPEHGVRFMHGHRGGGTAGKWYKCYYCQFKEFVQHNRFLVIESGYATSALTLFLFAVLR